MLLESKRWQLRVPATIVIQMHQRRLMSIYYDDCAASHQAGAHSAACSKCVCDFRKMMTDTHIRTPHQT